MSSDQPINTVTQSQTVAEAENEAEQGKNGHAEEMD